MKQKIARFILSLSVLAFLGGSTYALAGGQILPTYGQKKFTGPVMVIDRTQRFMVVNEKTVYLNVLLKGGLDLKSIKEGQWVTVEVEQTGDRLQAISLTGIK
jgi:hypothetical protein